MLDGADITELSVQNSEIILNWATTVVIVFGLLGASWKWIFERIYLNRRQRIDDENAQPDLYGHFSCETHLHNEETVAILIKSMWENAGNRSVYASTQDSVIFVYEVENITPGVSFYEYFHNKQPDYQIAPLAKFNRYRMGGNTKSEITNIVMLPRKKDYYLYIHIWEEQEREPGQRWGWFRDCYLSRIPAS